MNAGQQELVSANDGFAYKLVKEIAKEQPGKNIFISPYSASTVLHMVCNGAGGNTKEEMQRMLGTTSLPADVLNEANRDCLTSVNNQGSNVVLTIANSMWYRKTSILKGGFILCNQRYFGATVEGLDFSDPRSAEIINAWASEETLGRIKRIADGLVGPLTRLFVDNAVYFKGKWRAPFEVERTRDRPFHLQQGHHIKVPMMQQEGTFIYRRGTEHQAV
jgi:serine protease inhibitor